MIVPIDENCATYHPNIGTHKWKCLGDWKLSHNQGYHSTKYECSVCGIGLVARMKKLSSYANGGVYLLQQLPSGFAWGPADGNRPKIHYKYGPLKTCSQTIMKKALE